jgi:hypothetical protein
MHMPEYRRHPLPLRAVNDDNDDDVALCLPGLFAVDRPPLDITSRWTG